MRRSMDDAAPSGTTWTSALSARATSAMYDGVVATTRREARETIDVRS